MKLKIIKIIVTLLSMFIIASCGNKSNEIATNTPNDDSSEDIEEIIVGQGMDTITSNEYINNENLKYIRIADSVVTMYIEAFNGCINLKRIVIPKSVQFILGFGTCRGCENLSEIIIDEENEWYDSRDCCNAIISKETNTLLFGCNGTIIPKTVESIGMCAFNDCNGLEEITIPKSVKWIGGFAFQNCVNLKKVNIESIESWCQIQFSTVDDNPLYYAHNLYINNELITDLVIPNSVTSIGKYAFFGCSNLKSIVIPDTVTTIYEGILSNCFSLESITIPFIGKNKNKDNNATIIIFFIKEKCNVFSIASY